MAKIHLEAEFWVLRGERQAVNTPEDEEPCGQQAEMAVTLIPPQSHLFKRSVNIGHDDDLLRMSPTPCHTP